MPTDLLELRNVKIVKIRSEALQLLLADRHERTDKAGQSSGDFLQLLII
jgi:hypothetical protein